MDNSSSSSVRRTLMMVYLPNKQPWFFISYCKDSKSKLRGARSRCIPGHKAYRLLLFMVSILSFFFFLFLLHLASPDKIRQLRQEFLSFSPCGGWRSVTRTQHFFSLGETHPIIMNSHNNVMMRDHYYKTAWCRISTTSILSTPLLGLWSLYRINAPMKWVFCVAQNNQGVGTI